MKDYRSFSYLPDYDFVINDEEGRLIEKEGPVKYAACFARVFDIVYGKNTIYNGIYTLRCRKQFKERSGNYCSLEKPQILKILRYMRKNLDIKIHFTDTPENYVFVFYISGKPIKHKFALTFSRVFYEFPYNEIAKDVLKLRALGNVGGIDYSHKSFIELFHLMVILHQDYWGTGHSLFYYACTDLSSKRMKDMFKTGCSRVQEVYEGDASFDRKFKRYKTRPCEIDWDDDFMPRAIQYSEKFKILKELKNKNEKGIRRRARKVI